jgi:hypothetical protein
MENTVFITEQQLKEREGYWFEGIENLPFLDQQHLIDDWNNYIMFLEREKMINHER